VHFGVHAGLQNTQTSVLRDLWRHAEDAGFEWISVWDHFYAADPSGGAECLEAVSTHTALATATSRVRCGSLVYSVGYRHPAVLANAMATIDHFSGGRVTLGLGAGWHQGEYDAYGIPFPSTGVRLAQLDEAIQCIRGLLTQEVTNFDGQYFQLCDARCEPRPVQHRLPIWIGGAGEKVTLRIAAKYADGWNVPFLAPDAFVHKVDVLHTHCADVGRDPAEITKSINLGLAWTDESLHAQFGGMAEYVKPGVLTGSAQEMIDRVGAYRDAGAEWCNIAMRAPFDIAGLERFTAEVAPAFRS
jgi:F420-dependent oxidoreductase-like protein